MNQNRRLRVALIVLPILLPGISAAASAAANAAPPATTPTSPDRPPTPTPPDFAAVSRSLPPLPTTETGWRIPLDNAPTARWTPIRGAVRVHATTPSDDESPALRIDYTRAPRTASGAALVTPYGSFVELDALVIRASAMPDQRLFVTLTDTNGVVWTFPTVGAVEKETTHTLRVADLKPDAFQNQGKTVPAEPDMTSIVMLTILDVSGYMGAPEAECAWTITAIEGVRR